MEVAVISGHAISESLSRLEASSGDVEEVRNILRDAPLVRFDTISVSPPSSGDVDREVVAPRG
jgi:hypothetical protein